MYSPLVIGRKWKFAGELENQGWEYMDCQGTIVTLMALSLDIPCGVNPELTRKRIPLGVKNPARLGFCDIKAYKDTYFIRAGGGIRC